MSEDDRKMFVGGIAQEASEQDLRDYFEKYGEVESVILKLDPLTRRSRCVTYMCCLFKLRISMQFMVVKMGA